MADLLHSACPFCGGLHLGLLGEVDALNNAVDWSVACFSCKAHGPKSLRRLTAVTDWNSRSNNRAMATIDGAKTNKDLDDTSPL